MIGAVLNRRFTAYKNPGNLNSHIGLPLAILGMEPGYEYAVLEMAMRARGEIKELCGIAKPKIGVLTDISASHIGVLGNLEEISLAKRELLESLPQDGLAVLCHDNELVLEAGHARCKVTYGFSPTCCSDTTSGLRHGHRFQGELQRPSIWVQAGSARYQVQMPSCNSHRV